MIRAVMPSTLRRINPSLELTRSMVEGVRYSTLRLNPLTTPNHRPMVECAALFHPTWPPHSAHDP
jgi:hypothetical protein